MRAGYARATGCTALALGMLGCRSILGIEELASRDDASGPGGSSGAAEDAGALPDATGDSASRVEFDATTYMFSAEAYTMICDPSTDIVAGGSAVWPAASTITTVTRSASVESYAA